MAHYIPSIRHCTLHFIPLSPILRNIGEYHRSSILRNSYPCILSHSSVSSFGVLSKSNATSFNLLFGKLFKYNNIALTILGKAIFNLSQTSTPGLRRPLESTMLVPNNNSLLKRTNSNNVWL